MQTTAIVIPVNIRICGDETVTLIDTAPLKVELLVGERAPFVVLKSVYYGWF